MTETRASTPTVSLVIPSVSRPTLARTLLSLAGQPWIPGDEILLVGDGPQSQAREMWEQLKLPGRYLETPERLGFWGHGARNWLLDQQAATGGYLAALDDDDVWTPDSLAVIRAAIAERPGHPHIFRMDGVPNGIGLVWKTQQIRERNVGTPMLVVPNDFARLGRYTPRYGGDCDFVRETCSHYCDGPEWHEDVICRVRPE